MIARALVFAALVSATPGAPAGISGQELAPRAVPFAEDSLRSGPKTADVIRQTDEEFRRIDLETRELERQLARQATRRDALLGRLEREPSGGLLRRLEEAWESRQMRAELERLVAELQSGQARLLALRARRLALADAAAERAWEHLEALVSEAADALREGRAEEPMLGPAIADALDRASGKSTVLTVEHYRSLVEQLARVNAVLGEVGQDTQAARLAGGPESEAGAGPDGWRKRGAGSDTGASGFLGVAERGLPVVGPVAPEAASREAWKRLRTTLVNEIVSTATEITLRVRETS